MLSTRHDTTHIYIYIYTGPYYDVTFDWWILSPLPVVSQHIVHPLSFCGRIHALSRSDGGFLSIGVTECMKLLLDVRRLLTEMVKPKPNPCIHSPPS